MIDLNPQMLTELLTALGVLITAIVSLVNVVLSKQINTKVDDTKLALKALREDRAATVQGRPVTPAPPPVRG